MTIKTKNILTTLKPSFWLGGVMCRLGFHKWENIDHYTPTPKEGEMICFQNLHRCKRYGKEKYLGMGCVV